MKSTLMVCDLSGMTRETAEHYLTLISDDRRRLIGETKLDSVYMQRVVSSGLLEGYLDAEGYRDISYRYSDRGKPYLAMEGAPFFSISHSGSFVAVAVSENPVGVDIEAYSAHKTADLSRLSDRFFSARESEWIAGDRGRFLEAWTYKEAYAKAGDRKLASNLDKWEYPGTKGGIMEFVMEDDLFSKRRFGRGFDIEPKYPVFTFKGTGFIGCFVDTEP